MTTVGPSEAQAKQSRGRKSGNYPFLSQWVVVGFCGGWEFTLEVAFWDAVNRGREDMASQMVFFLVIQCTGGSSRIQCPSSQAACASSPRLHTQGRAWCLPRGSPEARQESEGADLQPSRACRAAGEGRQGLQVSACVAEGQLAQTLPAARPLPPQG